jgi:hypothetical protein
VRFPTLVMAVPAPPNRGHFSGTLTARRVWVHGARLTPENAADVRMVRLFDDMSGADTYLDPVTTQWMRGKAQLLDVEVRQSGNSFAVLLPPEVMREFSGWNARVCSLASYDNTGTGMNALGAEVQVRPPHPTQIKCKPHVSSLSRPVPLQRRPRRWCGWRLRKIVPTLSIDNAVVRQRRHRPLPLPTLSPTPCPRRSSLRQQRRVP